MMTPVIIHPIGVEISGTKYVGLIILINTTNKIGIAINIYTISLELPVKDRSSNFNFFLLNNVFSIESNTLIIFPHVLF